MRRNDTRPFRGSHIPVLLKLINITDGPVLELGCGMYSTTFLHWACFPKRRKLVSYENHPRWFEFANQFKADFHDVILVEDWAKIDLSSPWSIALIDHAPNLGRQMELRRLRHADYVVLHDSEPQSENKYHYMAARRFFTYKWMYTEGFLPYTSIWSNKYDTSNFVIP